jgi:hypothetical protein
MAKMKSNSNHYEDFDDYEPYEEKKGRIRKVDSENHKRREIKNWKKAWSEHPEDYDERDEFFGKHVPLR